MADFNSDAVVSTVWLADHLNAPDVRVVDASYYLPHEGLSGRQEFELQHIPGAVFFDIDDIADSDDPLPHMLPAPEKFSSKVRKLGLGDGVRMVIYDQRGLMSAPRVWWTFRYFGHRDVAVLDGGLVKWLAEGRPVADGPASPSERHFTARVDSFLLRDKEQMRANLESAREQVLDARSAGRFEGSAAELRPGLRGGHIPSSLNLPYDRLLDRETLDPRVIGDTVHYLDNGRSSDICSTQRSGCSSWVDDTRGLFSSCSRNFFLASLADSPSSSRCSWTQGPSSSS